MPLYEYQCPKCGLFELIRKFSDEPVTLCPTCGSGVQKLASAPAFHLKGTGWYVTDYAKKSGGDGKSGKGKSDEGKSEGKSDSTAGDSKSGESKSSESKSSESRSGDAGKGAGSGSGKTSDSGKSADSGKSSKDTAGGRSSPSKKTS